MNALARRWRLLGLLMVAGCLAMGCSLPSLAYFLTTGWQEPKVDPGEMQLAATDGKEVKVAIVANCSFEKSPDFIEVDHDLSGHLTRQLKQSCAENKEKVTFVPYTKVQTYCNQHPQWFMKIEDLGKYFNADRVVYLEVQNFSLYERGSANQLYRGRANITMKLYDLRHPDDYKVEKTYTCEYPTTRGPVSVDDKRPREFYLDFMSYLVKHLSWNFTAHPVSDDISCD